MQTKCPKCLKVFEIPEHYLTKTVKCEGCKAEFCAQEYVEFLKLPDFNDKIRNGKLQECDPVTADIPTGNYLHTWGVIFGFVFILAGLAAFVSSPETGIGLIVGGIFIALLLLGLATIIDLLRLQLALLRKILEKSNKK
jgi:hypothetical protein